MYDSGFNQDNGKKKIAIRTLKNLRQVLEKYTYLEKCFPMSVSDFFDFFKSPKLHGTVLVNGWSDIFTVSSRFDTFQFSNT